MKDHKQDRARQPQASGKRIPDQPRDCGPHVDTWPILDAQVGDASKPRTDESGRRDAPERG